MAVKGVFASNQNIVGARKGDFASGLLQTQPTGSAPLLALSSGMASRDAVDTVATWFEENHLTGNINVTNNAASGTSFTVDDATQVIAGMIFYVESTGEYVYIDSVAASILTVTRGYGGTTVTALNGSSTPEPIQRIGTAFEEGSAKPTAYANLGFPRFNYMQIFRSAWDVTGTAAAVNFHTGDIVAKNKADAAIFHAEDIERSSIWGIKAIGTLNGKPFRSMDGLQAQILTNLYVESTNTAWADDMRPFLQSIFETNIKGQPNERIAFCGNTVLAVLEDMARKDSTINLVPGQTDFGMEIMTMRTPFGTVKLMSHPLFNENAVRTQEMMILHPAAIEYRYLRRTFTDDNDVSGSRAGADSDFGTITTEGCITYKAEKTAGYATGISTAAASS